MAQVRKNRAFPPSASQTTGADTEPDLKEEGSKPSVQDEIDKALKNAQTAADSAESALDEVPNLPSSRVTPQVCFQCVGARQCARFPWWSPLYPGLHEDLWYTGVHAHMVENVLRSCALQVLVFMGALLRRLFMVGFVLVACAHLLLTQDSSFPMKTITAAAITVAIGFGGYAKKSLDLTGAASSAGDHSVHQDQPSATTNERGSPDPASIRCIKGA